MLVHVTNITGVTKETNFTQEALIGNKIIRVQSIRQVNITSEKYSHSGLKKSTIVYFRIIGWPVPSSSWSESLYLRDHFVQTRMSTHIENLAVVYNGGLGRVAMAGNWWCTHRRLVCIIFLSKTLFLCSVYCSAESHGPGRLSESGSPSNRFVLNSYSTNQVTAFCKDAGWEFQALRCLLKERLEFGSVCLLYQVIINNQL